MPTGKFRPDLFEHDDLLQDFYDWANKKYFGRKLPRIHVGYSHDPVEKKNYGSTFKINGAAFSHCICINPIFRKWPDTKYMTILHEMVHVKFNNRYGHGPKFKKEMKRLMLVGAFEEFL